MSYGVRYQDRDGGEFGGLVTPCLDEAIERFTASVRRGANSELVRYTNTGAGTYKTVLMQR